MELPFRSPFAEDGLVQELMLHHDRGYATLSRVHHAQDIAEVADWVRYLQGSGKILVLDVDHQECSAHLPLPQALYTNAPQIIFTAYSAMAVGST
jgi:hypothetical protein